MTEALTIPAVKNEPAKAPDAEINPLSSKEINKKPQPFIQTKLTVGAPDDPYEKEADAVADKVMRMPEKNFVQRKCARCEEEQQVRRKPLSENITPFVQTKIEGTTPVVSDALSNKLSSSQGGGSNMDSRTRSFMSSRFGADFGKVKIHTDNEAVQMNRKLNARALTTGNDIYFNEGQYNPKSGEGKKLLAHELVHTLQQGQSGSYNIQKQDDDVVAESEGMRDRFRQDRLRDLRRIIDCNVFHKIRRDCPVSSGVRLADVLAGMRTRVAGNPACLRFFRDRFNINPDIMFDPARRPSITFDPGLTVSGRTRCPEPTCDSPIPSVGIGNICNSPLLERVVMHELTHYAHCYGRWGDTGDEATSELASTICMGTVQQALDAARGRTTRVQPKLMDQVPGNSLESVRDNSVMKMPETHFIRRKGNQSEPEKIQPKVLSTVGMPFINANNKVGVNAGDSISGKINETKGSGNRLDPGTKFFMESRFGNDFGGVKIHTGGDSIQMNRELNAKAFTTGNDIYFNEGQYNPDSVSGKHLLAHELTHTVQQGSGSGGKIQRWAISGNTATADSASDYLGRLAVKAGGAFNDWKCIKPLKMKTASLTKVPADFNDHYENYVQMGDQFDISNLNNTAGGTLNVYLFDDATEKKHADLAKLFYPGSDSSLDVDADIDSSSNSGANPIGSMVLFGHQGGGTMWGGASTFAPKGNDPEDPKQSHTLASVGLFPRRCWFARNAVVRSVGCESEAFGKDFARAYLRKGSKVITTTTAVRPKCSASKYNAATDTCTSFDGLDFAASFSKSAAMLEGPFYTVAAFHGGSYWKEIAGKL